MGAAVSARSGEATLPEHHAGDPSAPEVSSDNLMASEQFWPYSLELTSPWTPPSIGRALAAGTRGVLIRVESAGSARVDFGRHGLFDVPVAKTDLLAQANQIRLGKQPKFLPSFVEAIGPRLVSSQGDSIRPLPIAATYAEAGFLCVYAEPSSAEFAALARALAPLAEHPAVMTILFPQGRPSDLEVYERLRSLAWRAPFVMQHLSEPYTRTLVGAPELPFVSLHSREGRMLFQARWTPTALPALAAALEAAFGSIRQLPERKPPT